jgi:pimeloyl-ACP methyl ester carboxylesterase
MKKFLKIIKWIAYSLVGLCLLIIIGLGVFRIHLGNSTKIETPNGISSLEEIKLGGVEQWIFIRGTDQSNPVLVFLHGGPGAPMPGISSSRTHDSELINHFTVVHWDQRGTGKSYDPEIDVSSMTYDQLVEDCSELIDYLRDRLDVEKVFLVGYSSGSVIGAKTAYKYPEKIHAYVGVGQIINDYEKQTTSYDFIAAEAEKAGDEDVLKALQVIGPPPYVSFEEQNEINGYISKFGGVVHEGGAAKLGILVTSFLTSPEYSLSEGIFSFMLKDYDFTMNTMWEDVGNVDIAEEIQDIEVPIYFFEGKYDMANPTPLVEELYDNLDEQEGVKLFIFENSAHFLLIEEEEKYVDLLINVVLAENLKE